MVTRTAGRSVVAGFFVSLMLLFAGACGLTDPGFDNPYVACYDNSCVSSPVLVNGVPPLAQLTANSYHVCGLTDAGDVWCWGDNSYGQLGDGTDQPRATPVKVTGGVKFASLSAGGSFTCGIGLDGFMYCWGLNATSQLAQASADRCGTSQVMCAKSPLKYAKRSFTDVAAGTRYACALDPVGAPWCWGFDFLGETGNSVPSGTTITAPTTVSTSAQFASVYAGDMFTCGLTAAGHAWCWGSDNRGELGRVVPVCGTVAGFQNLCTPVPGAVNTSSSFTSLSLSNGQACGLRRGSGSALCWGDNGQGQLGTHEYANAFAPVTAQGGATYTTIVAGGNSTCATPTAGTSVCWGLNMFGKLGIGPERVDLSLDPLPVAGGQRFVSFAGGSEFMCGLTANGAVYCWGGGRMGQLGAGPKAP